ncbi:hypothetical protein D9757_007975 [Collybiopsis confluens]|uniref:Uncharacterized protein n=1 Tax=Collybiopsis confluens TaxID=2823264 RepID=A0A8H5M4C3_9AGAR|nr:hypothetical protein D9757_007975 [Collybiopsis confluens]
MTTSIYWKMLTQNTQDGYVRFIIWRRGRGIILPSAISATSAIAEVKAGGNPSQHIVDRMNRARDAATAATSNYFVVLGQAQQQWIQIRELYPNLDFWGWIAAGNYPPLDASTQTELFSAMQAYYGPDAASLSGYITNITNAFNGSAPLPGYNQSGMIDDPDLIATATQYANSGVKPPESDIRQSLSLVPAYTIQTYTSTLQAWITASGHGATRDQVITIDINQGRSTTWDDYGFKEVRGGGGVGFWPFFWAEDVPNIKTLFPNRLPGAPDVLSSKFAKISSVLVGYDVELKLDFASEMRDEVNSIYEEVESTGGNMSIFGFRVSAGGGGGSTEHVVAKFEDVKWDKSSGSMSLTPTAGQVYPTILAAVALAVSVILYYQSRYEICQISVTSSLKG